MAVSLRYLKKAIHSSMPLLSKLVPESPRSGNTYQPFNGVNDIEFTDAGPFKATLVDFILFAEIERQPDPDGKRPRPRKVDVGTCGSTSFVKVRVEFEDLKNRAEAPLVLSHKYRASREANSVFAALIAALANVNVRLVKTTEYDTDDFIGRRVWAHLKPNAGNAARISKIDPMEIEQPFVPGSHNDARTVDGRTLVRMKISDIRDPEPAAPAAKRRTFRSR